MVAASAVAERASRAAVAMTNILTSQERTADEEKRADLLPSRSAEDGLALTTWRTADEERGRRTRREAGGRGERPADREKSQRPRKWY